jgi:hypothetical protein
LVLDVIDELDSITRQTYPGIFQGAVRPAFDWQTNQLEGGEAEYRTASFMAQI